VLAYGRYGTPHARIIHETITAWFHIVRAYIAKGDHIEVITAWSTAHKALITARKDATYSNAGTRGLMSNVISMLLNIGWKPTAYNVWEDPITGIWTLTDASVAPHIIIRKLVDTVHTNRLRKAQIHHNGKGIGEGVDWHGTLRYAYSLKVDTQYNQKCTLETIICGATWPNARVHDIYDDVEDICSRCGAEGDTDFRTFWHCPANENIESEAIKQKPIPHARSHHCALDACG